jgi:hypothetical protein
VVVRLSSALVLLTRPRDAWLTVSCNKILRGRLQRQLESMLWLFLVPEFCWGVAQWLPVAQDAGSSTERAPLTSAAPMRSSRGG